MRNLDIIIAILLSTTVALATPYVGFSFDEQLPTIARADKYYDFQLNNETYVSDVGAVTFEIDGLPSWLSFDSSTRTLTGTPTTNDTTDTLTFTLIGTDDTGFISNNYSIIVSADPGPELSSSDVMFEELSTFGNTNGYDGLVLESGEQFTLNFSTSTFDIPADSDAQIVAYYGRSSDRTSLPSWIKFNEETVSFYGTAPAVNSKIAPSMEFGFALIATDVAGYAGAIGTFEIIVGAHELSTSISSLTIINGTVNQTINYTIPYDEIYLDGEPISTVNVSSAALSGNPSWISLNGESIVGTVPSSVDSDSSEFNFTLIDVYSNSISVLYEVNVLTSLFTVDSIPEVNATRGEYFSYTLMDSMFTDLNDTEVSASFEGDSTDWIQFHGSNLTFNGQVPDDLEDLSVEITATKSSSSSLSKRDNNDDNTLSFEITGVDETATSSSSRSSSSHKSSSSTKSSSTASSTSSSSSASKTTDASTNNGTSKSSGSSNKKKLTIALAVAIPLAVLLILALILIFCCCRRRREKEQARADQEKSPSQISGPILGNPANNPNHNDSATMDSYNDDDDEDSPKRLSTLNVLRLENKEYEEGDSDASSTTNVEGDDRSVYQDALQTQSTDQLVYNNGGQVPKRSWRRPTPRESMASLNTVATEELFTVRAVDEENVKRQSAMSMFYPTAGRESDFFGSPSSSILTRDSTANFQRLDSDGNIISMSAPYSDNRLSSRAMSNLEVLREESGHNVTLDTTEYMSAANELSNSNSSQNIGSSVTSTSIPDEFRARETSSGDLKWDHINDSSQMDTSKFDFEPAATRSSSRYNSTMTFANNSDSTILGAPPTMAPQRQASTASARARLVEFENQKRAYNFDPILDHGEESDESEHGEISFMV